MRLNRVRCRFAVWRLWVAGICLSGFAAAARAGHVCVDAESATHVQAPMRRVDAGNPEEGVTPIEGASRNTYLEIPAIAEPSEEDKQAHAKFKITLEEGGDYVLWMRVWWDDECSNSFRVGINDQSPFILGRNRVFRRWNWVRSPPRTRQLTLEAGTHTLKVLYREDRVRLDQILLTTDPRFVPVDIEPLTSQP